MPILHEKDNDQEYIYEAIINGNYKTTNNKYYEPGPVYIFDPVSRVYKYSNTLYPTRNYTKIFDPSFMIRGDVINFGGGYRNENKLIYDGNKLKHLYIDFNIRKTKNINNNLFCDGCYITINNNEHYYRNSHTINCKNCF